MNTWLIQLGLNVMLGALTFAGQPFLVERQSGALSTVTLLEISRQVSATDISRKPGADDSILLNFLITRKTGIEGPFTLSELQDLVVEDQSYSSASRAASNGVFGAETVLYGVGTFRGSVRPDLASLIPSNVGDEGVVMSTLFSGARLQNGGSAEVAIDVGWNDKTEKFYFAFRIPR